MKINFKNLFLRVSLQEQILFAKHLSIMTKAGMPLLKSLLLVQKQAKAGSLSKILKEVVVQVDNGQFLSASLEPFRQVFGNLFINMIRVGEASGTLTENLNYIVDEMRKKQELRSKIRGAMIYPVVILFATFGIVGLLMFFVFPKILPVFASLKVELPITTRALIATNEFLMSYWHLTILGVVVIGFAWWGLLKLEPFRFFIHKIIIRTPIVGKISAAVNMANFTRTLGLLLKSGVRIVEATNISADTLSNSVFRKALQETAVEVTKGQQISEFMAKNPIFPIMLTQMISVGESTGNLSETLMYLSEYYENEVDELTKELTTVLEPMLLLFMGVMVGFVALSIVTPIYSVTQNLGGGGKPR